ncbi:DUF899 domain-containing protein [Sphingobacteriales bacterium UPWRP_1]|nr:hypothetical protein B6N25_10715 [Sphingobacteriales bacterium TSM_CSS]PSJ73064.1 DUF899 domain-containing protein [Sphingobacteriales bacterium UPWRP_1]
MEREAIFERIEQLHGEMQAKRQEINNLRRQMPPEPVLNYILLKQTGEPVALESLFDHRNELLVIHNMGKKCVYCTLWADVINGMRIPLANRAPFVVVSPDEPQVQREFAESRGWQFTMLSAAKSPFTKDLGFATENEKGIYYLPGVSAFTKQDGQIYRTSYDFFGPGDDYCSVWHFFELLPNGVNKWQPKYNYL